MRRYFDKTISLERLVINGDKEEYVSMSTVKGDILPIGANDILLSEGNPARECKLYTDTTTDIKETDRITYNGRIYIIRAVRIWQRNSIAFKEALIEEIKN